MNRWFGASDPIGRWGARGRLVALLDQAIYTGSNFVVTMSLAAAVGVGALGRYALISSVSSLTLGLLASVTLDPMTVFGSHSGGRRVRAACTKESASIGLCLVLAACCAFGAARYAGWEKSVDLSLGLLLCGSQYCVLSRKRTLYIETRVGRSTVVSAVYAAGMSLIVVPALATKRLSVEIAVLAVLVGATLASGNWVRRCVGLRVRALQTLRRTDGFYKYILSSSGTSVSGVLAYQGIYWVGALTGGLILVGRVKLIEQLALPFSQILIMLSLPDQVLSSRDFAQSRFEAIEQRIARRTRTYMAGAFAYSLLLLAVVVAWEWSHHSKELLSPAIAAYGLVLILQSASYPRLTAMRAQRRPYVIGGAYVAMGICLVLGGVLLHPATSVLLVLLLAAAWATNLLVLQLLN